MENIRVRFAPSPTGPLHIGGVRTALYNYLFARKHNGTFILRIEDTDRNRFAEGAEEYIHHSLNWTGINPDEGPQAGGDYGPYRQSERINLYRKYVNVLIEKGFAYKAYDSEEEIEAKRAKEEEQGNENWKYDARSRGEMKNSLTLSEEEVETLEDEDAPYVVRFKIPSGKTVSFTDLVRGKVSFETDVLDDKVLLKEDGYPTYHLANIVDDHLMKISHVIRGEEWLSSTPLHVLLYEAFGWEQPAFAHLPLILKPEGKGKLSKRDGEKFGFPVFPINWKNYETHQQWPGFLETGFLPDAFVNMLAFLGWNPGTEQEIFTLEELVEAFDIDRVSKSGARFNYDKAKWFNQQHIIRLSDQELAKISRKYFDGRGYGVSWKKLEKTIGLFKERVEFISELPEASYYLFEDVKDYDEKAIRKKWKPELTDQFLSLVSQLKSIHKWNSESVEKEVKYFMEETGLGFGKVLPVLRLAVCGTMQGPSIFHVMGLLTKGKVTSRIEHGIRLFNEMKESN